MISLSTSLSGIVQQHKPSGQVLPVSVSFLDGLHKLLLGDPVIFVLVHLIEHILTFVIFNYSTIKDRKIFDDPPHLSLADGPVEFHIKDEKHPTQHLLDLPKCQNVVDQHELLKGDLPVVLWGAALYCAKYS